MEPIYKNLGKVRPTIDNNNWSIDDRYDLLTIVYDPSSNKSYISRKDVPANVVIDNREYWLPFGVGKFVDNAIININYLDGVSQELVTYTLEEAIARIGNEDKRLGVIISFYGNETNDFHTPGWCLYQFMSDDLNDWNNINAWNSIYYNRNKNVGWFRTESDLLSIYPFPHKGDYCYIGTSLISSFVYRCYENGTWINTQELASVNIGITIGGNISISENGTWIVDNEDTGIKAVGTGIEKMTYTPSQEDGGTNILQIKLTDGTQFSFPIKNGNQGNSGIVIPDLETFLAELVNNLTTDDGTKALSAAQGVVLNNKISQLGQKVDGLIYDISDITGDSYPTLSAALADVPISIRNGGVTVKFINSSTSKYEQWRLMDTQFSTDVSLWQGVDDVPTTGSSNLVKSGGVKESLDSLNFKVLKKETQVLSNLEIRTVKDNLDIKQSVDNIDDTEENGFFITDFNGKIIFKVSVDSIDAVDLGSNSRDIITNIAESIATTISTIITNAAIDSFKSETVQKGFYITDKDGKIYAKIVDGELDALDFGNILKSKIQDEVIGIVEDGLNDNAVNYALAFNKEYNKLNTLRDELLTIAKSVEDVKETGGNTFVKNITIASSASNRKHEVIRIGLHYGQQIGDEVGTEIFFGGNVRKDFSDVRVKDSNGNILPVKLLHHGNYEVVKDSNIKGFFDHVYIKDGKAYFPKNKRIHITSDEYKTSSEFGINQSVDVASSAFFIDSEGGVWFEALNHKIYVCYPSDGIYDFSNQIELTDISTTNGITNTGSLMLKPPIEDDLGYVYFGIYQTNWNPVIFRTINPVSNGGLLPDGSNNYVFECYHQTIIYQQDGVTVDPDRCDQHVHHMHIFKAKDQNGNDVCNIIACLDNSNTAKGPNIISSIDRGVNWISFRDTINLPWDSVLRGHDYSFTWMSDDNSYTSCMGESNALGGYTLSKLYTDVDTDGRIYPVAFAYPLSTRNGCREMTRANNNTLVPTPADNRSYDSNILLSEDNLKSWRSIYHDVSPSDPGIGHGVRVLSVPTIFETADSVTPCCYGNSTGESVGLRPIRVYFGGSHYYGELLVDVGEIEANQSKTLTIESGYLAAQPNSQIFNREEIMPIWSLPLNEGTGDTVTDSDGYSYKIHGSFKWDKPENTMQFGGFVPYIRDYKETGGLKLDVGSYIDLRRIKKLNFNKNFSLVLWIARASRTEYGANNDYFAYKFPFIGTQDQSFSLGYMRSSCYVGGKADGSWTRGILDLNDPVVEHFYFPICLTVSNDTIPTITAYYGDNNGWVLNVITASSWPSVLLSDLVLRIGSDATDTSTGFINKAFYLHSISIYNKVLNKQEFLSITNGRTITL